MLVGKDQLNFKAEAVRTFVFRADALYYYERSINYHFYCFSISDTTRFSVQVRSATCPVGSLANSSQLSPPSHHPISRANRQNNFLFSLIIFSTMSPKYNNEDEDDDDDDDDVHDEYGSYSCINIVCSA